MDTHRLKTRAAAVSVLSNTTLVALKLIIGIMIGSVSVISEAIHSGVDLLAAIIALFAVRTAGKPADEDHPFGHGKIENISGTVEALLIFVAAVWIIYEAVKKLTSPEPIEAAGWGVGVMLISAVANQLVSCMLFRVGKATESVALQADGWHLRTDVYTSAGVMAGLLVITIGRLVVPGVDLRWVDPVAAMAVALLIIKAAYGLTKESARDLLDNSLPQGEEQTIRDCISGHQHKIVGFHKLRTRKSGSDRFAEFHLLVSPDMSVDQSHSIGDDIIRDIKALIPGCTVTIHIEPETTGEAVTSDQ